MLSKLQQLKQEREQGFTLIELLVVILIIGILAAIAIPAFLNQRKSAVDSSVQTDLASVAKSIETIGVKAGADGQATVDVATDTTAKKATVSVFDSSDGALIESEIVPVSKGSDISGSGLIASGDGYTITGTNEGGDVAKETGFTYVSTKGGLQTVAASGGGGGGGVVPGGAGKVSPDGKSFGKSGNATLTVNGEVEQLNYTIDAKITNEKTYENVWSYTLKLDKPINASSSGVEFAMLVNEAGSSIEYSSTDHSRFVNGVMTGTISMWNDNPIEQHWVKPDSDTMYPIDDDWETVLQFVS